MLLTRHLEANATLVSLLQPLAYRTGLLPTLLPEVNVWSADKNVARCPQIYEPSLVIIAQGSKIAYLGKRTLEYGAGHGIDARSEPSSADARIHDFSCTGYRYA